MPPSAAGQPPGPQTLAQSLGTALGKSGLFHGSGSQVACSALKAYLQALGQATAG